MPSTSCLSRFASLSLVLVSVAACSSSDSSGVATNNGTGGAASGTGGSAGKGTTGGAGGEATNGGSSGSSGASTTAGSGGIAGGSGGTVGGGSGTGGQGGSAAGTSPAGGAGGGASTGGQGGTDACAAVNDFFGCCDGNTVLYCNKGVLFTKDCTPGTCGWDATKSYYSCTGIGADPSGVHSMTCSGNAGGAAGGGGASAAGAGGGGVGGSGPNGCGVTFGTVITPVFGRLDGTILQVLVPTVPACGNDDNHAIVHLSVNGATYQMWVNVGFAAMPDVAFTQRDAALGNDPFSEGWHPGFTLDYVTTLGVHSTDFTPTNPDVLSSTLLSLLPVGANVSIYGTGFTTGDGGHLVHFNGNGHDGAVVTSPSTSPHFLIFDFTNQSF